jgi:MFS family permease
VISGCDSLSSSAAGGGLKVLKNRDFTLYLASRVLSTLATQMLMMAVGWQVYHITGRVLDLGLVGLSQFLPFLCLMLVSGHVADHVDRRYILLVCVCAYASCGLLLMCFAWRDIAHTLPIFAVIGVYGVTRAFLQPAAQSFVPGIVSQDVLRSALAVNSTANQVATIAGPSVGGVLYAVAEAHSGRNSGATLVYGATVILLLAAAGMVVLIQRRPPAVAQSSFSWSNLLQGLRFIWQRKTVLGAISLDLFAVLFGGATALLPAYTQDVLHGGPEIFGLLRAAPGMGAALTALLLAFWPLSRRLGPTMFLGVGAFGVATIVLGLTHQFWVAMMALVILGVGDMISVFVRSLLVQLQTPNAIRGRVSAVNAVFIGASNELGEFESGTTAAWWGLVPAIVAGGALTLVVAALWAGVLFRGLWRLQTFEQLKDSNADAV